MNTCKTCKYHSTETTDNIIENECLHLKIREDYDLPTDDKDDELLYSYHEGGWFVTGDNFGCIHHKEK